MSDLTRTRTGYRRALHKRWQVLWPIAAGLYLYPINNLPLRIGFLLSLAGAWGGLIFFYWDKKVIRPGILVVTGIVVVFMLSPGRKIDAAALRNGYITELSNYEGTKYVWGGENGRGIDCSGLVRSGLIWANWKAGISTLNPALVREGISLWWHDCSARALGEEYRLRTRRVSSPQSINEVDAGTLLPGDIAVTETGVHVLAYLGEQTWIEADPLAMRVLKVHTPSESPWFKEPVNVMRWTQLEERGK